MLWCTVASLQSTRAIRLKVPGLNKKKDASCQAPENRGSRFSRVTAFTSAAVEFAALAAIGVIQSGGAGIKRLVVSAGKLSARRDIARTKQVNIPEKKAEPEKKIPVEERFAALEKRLVALEKSLPDSRKSSGRVDEGKVAVELERHNLLIELARITKSYINTPSHK